MSDLEKRIEKLEKDIMDLKYRMDEYDCDLEAGSEYNYVEPKVKEYAIEILIGLFVVILVVGYFLNR